MWSPTSNTNKVESDNNKEKKVVEEDCTCAADGGPQLNVFKSNSKKDDKSGVYALEAAGDSGFISGPQTSSNIFSEPIEDDREETSSNEGAVGGVKFNIPVTTAPHNIQNKKLAVENIVLDSGCIDDEDFAEDDDDDANDEDENNKNNKNDNDEGDDDDDDDDDDKDEDDDDEDEDSHEATSITSVEEKRKAYSDDQQQQNQVQRELSSSAVAVAAVKVNNNNNTSTATEVVATANEQMILKNNVDAGMAEWFCNLSLQTDARPQRLQSQQQQQQQSVTDVAMNNLDIAGRRVAANSLDQSQKQAAGNTATTTPTTPTAIPTTTTTPTATPNATTTNTTTATATATATTTTTTTTQNLTPSNAWEQFYQQNDDGDTPLHLACISGYVDVVAALIRMAPHPCLFNIQNDEAQTPLHLAALTAQPKILRMLLIAGAEPTLRDRHGNTALHLSCLSGEEQCVRALTIPISASEINEAHRLYGHRSNDKMVSYLSCARLPSDLEIRNYDGERCVHLAAQAGHIDILRILVLYGADINAREGKSGRTPLHIAIECCNEDVANFLLDDCQKLNLETATYAGLTAYQVACILNKSQMQNILEKRGAEPLTPPDSDYDSDIETDLDDSKLYDRFGDPGYFVGYSGGNPMTVA